MRARKAYGQNVQALRQVDLAARREVAEHLIMQAGALAQSYFLDPGRQAATRKGAHDWVTAADRAVEDMLRGALLEAFPQDHFLGEESGASSDLGHAPLWVVDPIDGTQEFARGSRNWCITIALVHGDQVQLGLVLDPMAQEFYCATYGAGATLNGQPMAVSSATDLADGVVTIEFSTHTPAAEVVATMSRLLDHGGTFQRGGSGALGLCQVATGRSIGFVEAFMYPWDCLAPLLLISEAGGRCSDFIGQGSLPAGGPVVAGTPGVYDELCWVLSGHQGT
jgi:myo-inositol-1(or 4)-monophosphatase